MSNQTNKVRCGILQHMVPLYITPFEDLTSGRENEEKVDNFNISKTYILMIVSYSKTRSCSLVYSFLSIQSFANKFHTFKTLGAFALISNH